MAIKNRFPSKSSALEFVNFILASPVVNSDCCTLKKTTTSDLCVLEICNKKESRRRGRNAPKARLHFSKKDFSNMVKRLPTQYELSLRKPKKYKNIVSSQPFWMMTDCYSKLSV